jgi:PAS domain S-box-containing protein
MKRPFSLIAVFLFITGSVFSGHGDTEPRHVILLHSYHQGYSWTDSVTRGALHQLKEGKTGSFSVELDIRYLNSRHRKSDEERNIMLGPLMGDFETRRYRAVITVDDEAARFMMRHRDLLDPEVPVIFGGTDRLDPSKLALRRGWTGFGNSRDLGKRIDLAMRLQPGLERFVVFGDTSEHTRSLMKQFRELEPEYRDRLEMRFLSSESFTSIRRMVRGLHPSRDALFRLGIEGFRNSSGNLVPEDVARERLARIAPCPVYSFWEESMGGDPPLVMGGYMESGEWLGIRLMDRTFQVLGGKAIEDMPVAMKRPARYVFDHRLLRKHNINEENLPAESILKNREPKLLEEYPVPVAVIILLLLVLTGFIVLLVAGRRRLRRSQKELENLAGRFQKLHEGLQGHILFSADSGGNLLYLSPSLTHVLGFSPGELYKKPGRILVSCPENTRALEDRQVRLRLTGQAVYQLNVKNRDGESRIIKVTEALRQGANSGVFETDGIAEDITEALMAEEVIREQETLYQSLFYQLNQGMLMVNREGEILVANNATCRLAGHGQGCQQMPGENVAALFDEETNRKIFDFMHGRCDTEDVFEGRMYLDDQENPLEIEVRCTPLTYRGDDAFLLVLADLSRRKAMDRLMLESEKMISVGGLAAGMAHEINNPLGIIMQSAENMERRLSPDLERNREVAKEVGLDMEGLARYMEKRNIRDYLTSIREAGSRAADIVRSLLSFSLKQGSEMDRVDLNDLVRESVELARRDYELKKKYGIQDMGIDLNLSPDIPRVECSRTEIEHVIISIVRNAVQVLHEKGIEEPAIEITTGQGDRSGGKVYIDIHDNGPGLDEKIRNRIFEPFFTTKKVGEGTGLGLSVAYFIVQKHHGGKLEVKSPPGGGTTFRVELSETIRGEGYQES